MARGRFLSESIATDTKLNSLSVEAELVYLMTIPHLDRDGLIEGDPDVLWGKVCPKRRMFLDSMASFIQEWTKVGLVLAYDTDDGAVLWFKGFAKNQTGMRYDREGVSKFAPPPCNGATETVRSKSGVSPESVGSTLLQVQVQVKDQDQVKGFVAPTAATPTPQQEYFLAVCEAVGWDYKTLSEKDKGQVAQTLGILQKANYTTDDIRRFVVEIWFKDWRWEKHKQWPTLNQLRQDIGKLRSAIPSVAPPQSKGMATLNRLANKIGADS